MTLRPAAADSLPTCCTNAASKPGAHCKQCGAPVAADEIAMTKKLINRGATEYLCYPCLARFFDCDVALLRRKAEQFRAQGCTLFAAIRDKTD